jgi:hypothetical protein
MRERPKHHEATGDHSRPIPPPTRSTGAHRRDGATSMSTNPKPKTLSKMRVLLLALSFLLGGCATLIHGADQSVRVESEPSGARVEVDGRPVGKTPTTVDLKRGQDHMVQLYHAGHEPYKAMLQQGRSLWVYVNVINLAVPGMLVDLSTGAFHSLEPSVISPTLEASGQSDPNAR